MTRITVAVFAIYVLSGCMASQPPAVDQYVVRQIGDTAYIEKATPATGRSVAGALVGVGIAAGQQSKPIPLQPGTDYACKYQEITTADMSAACKKNR